MPTTCLARSSFPSVGHPQVGEQSHTEIQQPPPGPESYAPPYRPSLEEDSASLSGESLDGHLQGRCSLLCFNWEEVGVGGRVAGMSPESIAWNRVGRPGWMGAQEPMGMTVG